MSWLNQNKKKTEDAVGDLSKVVIGRDVVVRSNMSGVWMGRCTGCEPAGPALFAVTLENAQKIHAWENTAATSGLAIRGPGKGSRVCAPVEVAAVGDACEVLIATASAMRTLRAIAPWDFPER